MAHIVLKRGGRGNRIDAEEELEKVGSRQFFKITQEIIRAAILHPRTFGIPLHLKDLDQRFGTALFGNVVAVFFRPGKHAPVTQVGVVGNGQVLAFTGAGLVQLLPQSRRVRRFIDTDRVLRHLVPGKDHITVHVVAQRRHGVLVAVKGSEAARLVKALSLQLHIQPGATGRAPAFLPGHPAKQRAMDFAVGEQKGFVKTDIGEWHQLAKASPATAEQQET